MASSLIFHPRYTIFSIVSISPTLNSIICLFISWYHYISYLISVSHEEFSLNQAHAVYQFLTTVAVAFTENYCYQPIGGKALNKSTMGAAIYPVTPASFAGAEAPSPSLSVAEPPISYIVPASSPTSSIAPVPSAKPSSATSLPASTFTTVAVILLVTFIL